MATMISITAQNRFEENAMRMRHLARKSAEVRLESSLKRKTTLRPVIERIRANGRTSLREIANALNGSGLCAARGGRWTAMQVKRVLD